MRWEEPWWHQGNIAFQGGGSPCCLQEGGLKKRCSTRRGLRGAPVGPGVHCGSSSSWPLAPAPAAWLLGMVEPSAWGGRWSQLCSWSPGQGAGSPAADQACLLAWGPSDFSQALHPTTESLIPPSDQSQTPARSCSPGSVFGGLAVLAAHTRPGQWGPRVSRA